MLIDELSHWNGTGAGESDVERDPVDAHVGLVEDWSPGEDNARNPEGEGYRHVEGAGDGLVIEGAVFSGDDGGGDEEGDAGIVDAGEALHEGLLGDGRHCVPDC